MDLKLSSKDILCKLLFRDGLWYRNDLLEICKADEEDTLIANESQICRLRLGKDCFMSRIGVYGILPKLYESRWSFPNPVI